MKWLGAVFGCLLLLTGLFYGGCEAMDHLGLFGENVRVFPDGDEMGAKAYLGEARRLLHNFKTTTSFQNIRNSREEHRLPEGVVITLLKYPPDRYDIYIFKPIKKGGGMEYVFFGTEDGRVYVLDTASMTVRGPFNQDPDRYHAKLYSAAASKTGVYFATAGAWDSYLGFYTTGGRKKSIDLNPPYQSGATCMTITPDGKNLMIAGDNIGVSGGVSRIDPNTLAILTTTSVPVNNFFNNGAACDGEYAYFSAAKTVSGASHGVVVKVNMSSSSVVATYDLGAGINAGVVVYDKKRKCLYISEDNTSTKRLFKLTTDFATISSITLTKAAFVQAGGAIFQDNKLFLVTYGYPGAYTLVRIDLNTFTQDGAIYTFPPYAAYPPYGPGDCWAGSVVAGEKNVFVGVNKQVWGSSVFKINPGKMTLVKEKALYTTSFVPIRSGALQTLPNK